MSLFEIGKEYHRANDLHGRYGGSRQSGIVTLKEHPHVFIFTSSSGEGHGYHDEFREDGVFWYTGAGQSGDMEFLRGNKAIRDHKENAETIHLFESTRKAYVRYLGVAECLGHHEEQRPDSDGNLRSAIIFHLDVNPEVRSDAKEVEVEPEIKQLKRKSLSELRKAAVQSVGKEQSPKVRTQVARYRSEALKQYAVKRANGKCEGCEAEAPFLTKKGPFLECHHVHRLSDGGPDLPENVIALCPNCHRRAHYAVDAVSYNEKLKEIAVAVEPAE
jgi:5-methylcytosine-specific restriction enzyme A